MITITNNGPALTSTNYWTLEHARRGYLYLSTNAGCFRLLVPAQHAAMVDEMRAAEHIVVSFLRRRHWQDRAPVVEWLAEDGSDEPWSCHLSAGQIDRIPTVRDELPTWEVRVYTPGEGDGVIERRKLPAHLRWVDSLPCLEPLADTIARAAKKGGGSA